MTDKEFELQVDLGTAKERNAQCVAALSEPPHVDIGEFFICKGMTEGRVWIGMQDGEGGDFDIAKVEAVIRKFYDENF